MRHAAALLALLPMLACGSGGGSGGATPAFSQGMITGIGSITVTGVAWNTDAAAVEIDGMSALPDALEVGMVVRVEGQRSGDQGTAALVTYEPAIVGPVSASTQTLDGDDEVQRLALVVLGQDVIAEAGVTLFGDGIDIETDLDGDRIEASGFLAEDGSLHATRIDLAAVATPDRVAPPPADVPDGAQRVAIEGLVGGFASFSDFEVAGQPVDATRSVVRVEPTPIPITDGTRLVVDGRLDADGVLLPDAIKLRDADTRIAAEIPADGIDLAERTLTLLGATVQLDAATRFEDARDGTLPFGLDDLAETDFLVVRGVQLAPTAMRAIDVVRTDPGDVELRARVQGITWSGVALDRSITLLGVDVETDGSTDFVAFPAPGEEMAYEYLYWNLGAPLEIEDVADGDETSISLAREVELDEDSEEE